MLDFKTIDNWATNNPVEKRLPHLTTTESWLAEFERDPAFWQVSLGTSSGTVFGTTTGWKFWSWFEDEFEHDPSSLRSTLKSAPRQFHVEPSAGSTVSPAGYEQVTITFKPTLRPKCSRDEALYAPLIAVFPTEAVESIYKSSWIHSLEL